MAYFKPRHTSLLFEELEPRLLFSADGAEALAAEAVEQPIQEEPVIIVEAEPGAEADTNDAPIDQSTQSDTTSTDDSSEENGTSTAENDAPQETDTTDSLSEAQQDISAEPTIATTENIPVSGEDVTETNLDSETTTNELILINDSASDYEQLVDAIEVNDDLNRSFEVIILDDEQNGIEQVSSILADTSDLDALHIITHGKEGSLALGSDWLDTDDLLANKDAVSAWNESFTENGDILLYGCNISSNDSNSLTTTLSALTDADVASSDDITGHTDLGGDWQLEHTSGDIETDVALDSSAQNEWRATLAPDAGYGVFSNTSATPRFTYWNGSSFAIADDTDTLNARYRIMQGADAPTRDEKIVVGVDAAGVVTGEISNGSGWNMFSLGNLGEVSEDYWYGVDVAYEQLSGDAVVVWNDNAQASGDKLRYAVWNGSTWSTSPTSISAYSGNEPQNMKLAFDPGSDTMALVVNDVTADDYVLIWDGTSWGNGLTLDTSGTSESDQSAISVAFEAQTGKAMVMYGKDADPDVYYRVWDGSDWADEASLTAAAGATGEARWITSATDMGSNRIAVGITTSINEAWVAIWDGSSWETPQEIGTTTTGLIYPNLAVGFESTTGHALATYGEGTQTAFRYRTWDDVGKWSNEQTGTDLGAVSNSMTLDSSPTSDQLMLSVQDENSDLHYLAWNGNSWEPDNLLSSDTGEIKNQPFVFIYDQDGMLVEPNAAPVNSVPATQNTAIDTFVVFSSGNGNLISISDSDDTSVEVTLDATEGAITLNGISGLSFSDGSGTSDDAMTFSGLLTDVNNALDGLQFIPTLGFEGFGRIQISTTDYGKGGTGTPKSDVDSVTIEIGDVNSAPVNNIPGAQTIDQNGMLLFSAATGTAISISDVDAGGNELEVTLNATNGTVNLSGTAGLTFTTGTGTGDGDMVFTGAINDINSVLEGATFISDPGFTGLASLQITTDDLGHSGAGGAQNDTDTISITVAVPDHTLWMTFENDEATTGNPDIPDFSGGDIVNFGGTLTFEPGTTSGTFAKNFNLDLISGSDGNTDISAVHYVRNDIQVGSNNIQLQVGDLLMSTAGDETIGSDTFAREDVFVFRPTTSGDYSSGSFFMLIEGKNSGLIGDVKGIALVEQTTDVGDVTLTQGDFIFADGDKDIKLFQADQLGAVTTGTSSILIQGSDIDFTSNVSALHLVQQDTAVGDTSLTAGHILVGLDGDDSTVGSAPTISMTRQDLFLLDVTTTGPGTSVAAATLLFEGLDESLDSGNEGIWGASLQANVSPTLPPSTFNVDENSANGVAVGSVTASDPENATLNYAITSGNTNGAFTIDAATAQITVANSTALDFEINPSFSLTVAAIDDQGAYTTAPVTINLNNLDEPGTNDAPENSIPADQTIDRNGMLLFSSTTGTGISISDFDAGSNPVQVEVEVTNGTLNLAGTYGLSFTTGNGTADTDMLFTGAIADINTALEGATFVATGNFTGTASVKIVTNDQGNTGTGGPLSDTDTITITVKAPEQKIWLTFENDEGPTGSSEIPSITGGDVVTFSDITQLETSDSNPLASTTSGTLAYGFNLDTVLLSDGITPASDGNTIVNAVHRVSRDIQVGTNNIQLYAGDLLLSTDTSDTIGGVDYEKEDVFVFHPDSTDDYSQGSFFRLIDGKNDTSWGNVTAISLVERSTEIAPGVTLSAGEILVAHAGSTQNILRFTPGTLGDTTTGTTIILVTGADIDIGQVISGLHLVQADTMVGGRSLT
ncbi:MAG: DUF4347 domain-containing protein, partial [Desulfobacterales bacterium]|nr:DUF4347 domain-containing protein [Desulfobacterales bacterium]